MAGKKFVVEDIIFNPKDGGFVEVSEVDQENGTATKKMIIPVANVGYLYRGLAFDEDDTEIFATLSFKSTSSASKLFNEYARTQLKTRAYIKDQMNLSGKPKAYITIDSFTVRQDLMTTANSSFTTISDLPENISEGDVLTLMNPYGKKRYYGVITSIDTNSKTIQTSQIQNLFAGQWVYDLPSFLGDGTDNSWAIDVFESQGLDDYFYATDLEKLQPTSSKTIADNSISMNIELGDKYTAKCVTYLYSEKRQKLDICFNVCVKGTLSINDNRIGGISYDDSEDAVDHGSATETVVFRKGWNKVIIVYTRDTNDKTEDDGLDGFTITCDSKILSECGYFSKMTSKSTTDVDSLEETFMTSLKAYCSGEIRDSSYVDPVIKQRLGCFEISTGTTTKGSFTSEDDTCTMDMEQMIYDLYNKYQIMLNIDIPYEGTPTCVITKSIVEEYLKVINNNNTITNMSPVTEIESNNRLIVFDSDGIYRTTYAVKSDGTAIEEPSEISSRLGVVNTRIVYSDEEIDSLVKSYLPEELYNHKLTFTLRLIDKLYFFDNFNLGMPLKVWKDTDYYSTVLTGLDYTKESNKRVIEVNYTCGTVRTSLTKKLTTKFGVIR